LISDTSAFFAASKRKSEEESDTSEPAPKRVSTPYAFKNECRYLWSDVRVKFLRAKRSQAVKFFPGTTRISRS